MLARLVLPERERQHRAHQEQEEREDQVVEPEPLPLDVLELLGERRCALGAPPLAEGARELVAADDPEHVEAAEGVDREQALGAGG